MNWIEIAYLTEQCFLSDNIPAKKFQVLIDMSQRDVLDLLGNGLYSEIDGQLNAKSLSAANAPLFDRIKLFMAWQTNFYYQKFANVSSTPTGLREFKDDNSDLLSDVKMFSYEKNIKERSDAYRNDIINFLSEARSSDPNSYPLWKNKCKEEMDFAITSVIGKSSTRTEIFKSVRYNE